MDEKRKVKISKFLSLVLRHEPEKFGVRLETGGWADVEELLLACERNGVSVTREQLEEVVATNDKKRFSFDESGARIRAVQGHSTAVEIRFEEKEPPAVLYHGTVEKNIPTILEGGLRKMSRHHVHLSADEATARNIGARRGKPVILQIDAQAMRRANFKFYQSENGVWLTESVPPAFLNLQNKSETE